MDVRIEQSWKEALAGEFAKPYFESLVNFLREEKAAGKKIFPPGSQIFRAFDLTPVKDVKVVILGQDPYHGPGQAHGLSFSVPVGVPAPPSLKNIFKELYDEYGIPAPVSGELVGWAKQGVLLLNATLSVRESKPLSHKGRGWETLTDAIIKKINEKKEPAVFLLWGGNARAKKALITNPLHLVLECAHPSPLSAFAGFFGCGHFKKANEFLVEKGLTPIDWSKINDT